MDKDFLGVDPKLEDYWRSVILFGRNVASYKFALAKALLEVAPTEKTFITLEELAEPFSRHLTEHLKRVDKQTTSRSSRFLETCRKYNAGTVGKDELIATTVKLGFNNVIDAFHNVGSSELGENFFRDERSGKQKGITLTDSLFDLLEAEELSNLMQEVEARWRLVETAWELNISRNLISVEYDSQQEILFTQSFQRIDVTSCRDALNGYQKGKCFYCFDEISIEANAKNLGDVDHFFPHFLGQYGVAQPIDGVWNLVLACQCCNRGEGGKFCRLPHVDYLKRLHSRNEYLINSHHPLRETLIRQTGDSEAKRTNFLQDNYKEAQCLTATRSDQGWRPIIEYLPRF